MTSQEKWDRRFLDLARFVSAWSLDPSTRVGAVIVDGLRRVVSVAYNGFAQGVKDLPERLESRPLKYEMTIHAEINAILFAKQPLDLMTLYTYPFSPCSRCAAPVVQSGIARVVAPVLPERLRERWGEGLELAATQFAEAGVQLDLIEYQTGGD